MLKVILLSLALGVVAVAGGESDVLVLGDSDFNSRLAEIDNALVMFYAPWCGHCKRLKPEFDKAAESLKDDDPAVSLVKVDCTEAGKDTCGKFGVSGYPTLKIFKNGEVASDYNGPREANGIVKYMRSQVGPASKELKTTKEVEAFTSKDDVSIVAYFGKDSKIETVYLKAADKLRETAKFGYSSDKDVVKGKEDTIVLYRPKHLANKFEPSSVVYDGELTREDIEKWVNSEYHGLVGVRTQDSSKNFKAPLVIAYFAVDYKKNPKGTNYWRNRILKVAQGFKGKFAFAISSKDEFQYEMNEYGIDFVPSEKPIITAKNSKNEKFIMSGEFSVEKLQTFLDDILEGKLEPFLKSEAIPEYNDGGVKIAVGKNFDDIVKNNGKDTLIEFYAPWCGHCKKLSPIFDELGEKMKGEDVQIVKMDATANDVPSDFEVRGFPTLFWIPKDRSAKVVKYEEGRELNDFVNFIAKSSTEELKGFDRSGKPKDVKSEL